MRTQSQMMSARLGDSREIKRELKSKFLFFCWSRYIGILYKSDIGELLNKWSRKE